MKTIIQKIKISFALILLFFCLMCSNDQSTLSGDDKEKIESADQEGWNSVVKATQNGQLRAQIQYGHMSRFSQKKLVKFDEDITIYFYNEAGEKSSELTAESGQLDENTNNMSAFGHVVVASDSGLTLYTEKLSYNDRQDKIYTDIDIMVTTPEGDTLYGTGFESDPRLINYTITRLHGVSNKSVDLSTERFKKKDHPE
ncbi:LPS export ABC transporter periplasmic protein LptC [candidate division KSB1 bacterium RBG_16_48_16]|nr:MAG: LPS export ABC transporter periplasmic protein LptC [candidate division KSB1 bacterium RBG_16_48_16]